MFRSENSKIGADPTLSGAHKWLQSWQPAVEQYNFELIPVTQNPIDNIWKGIDRVRNQEPLEILDIEFAGTFVSHTLHIDSSNVIYPIIKKSQIN